MELELERKEQSDTTAITGSVAMTPLIDKGYWSYRVKLSAHQAIVGFPKFFTIGIGFAVEDDWNTNRPYTTSAEEIYEHIKHNKGDASIKKINCIKAIRLVQDAVRQDRAAAPESAA